MGLWLSFFLWFFPVCERMDTASVGKHVDTSLGVLKAFHSETIKGMRQDERKIYISIDLCDGSPARFDTALFHYLERCRIPAIVFITKKWYLANQNHFAYLASQPLISIQNHGTRHIVPSYQKKDVFGVACATSLSEVVNEITQTHELIYEQTGKMPTLYRPATIYHDKLALDICKHLDISVMAYTFTTYNGVFRDRNTDQIADAINKRLCNGALILMHGNHPLWHEKKVLEKIISYALSKGYEIGHYQNNTSVLSRFSCLYPFDREAK